MWLASMLGCAQVGLQVAEDIDIFMPACGSEFADNWPAVGCGACDVSVDAGRGAIPSKPCSLPALTRKVRETFISLGVDLDEEIVHHAGGILMRAVAGDARSVGHDAGGDAGDFEHGVGVDDGNAAGDGIAVQVEIDDVEKIAVRGDVGGGGEKAETDLPNDAIIFGGVFDGGAEWAAVTDGDVEILAVG
jgi:hypothetical protein